MRVLAFSDHLSAASSGGAERVATQVYGRLAALPGVELAVVTVLRPGHPPARIPGARVVPLAGRDLSSLLRVEMLVSAGLSRQARLLHEQTRPDVIHANGLHFHGTVAAARLARSTGTPLVSTAHLGDLSALTGLTRLAGGVWDATIGAYAVRASTGLVAVSEAVAAHLGTLGAPAQAVTVAPNGVDHEIFHPRGRRDPGGDRPLRALFIGRLIDNKGPEVAIDAVAAARAAGRDVLLTLLGDGPLRPRLQARVDAAGLGAQVRFAGHVHDVADHLRRADVLVRPSLTEGLPLAVLEAMACATPVVCSSVAGNTEVVEHGVSGLHTPVGDTGAVADALVALCDDRGTLRTFAGAAATTAATYTWDRSAQLHLDALRVAARARTEETV